MRRETKAKAHAPWATSVTGFSIYSHLASRVYLHWNQDVTRARAAAEALCGSLIVNARLDHSPPAAECLKCIERLRRNPPKEWWGDASRA